MKRTIKIAGVLIVVSTLITFYVFRWMFDPILAPVSDLLTSQSSHSGSTDLDAIDGITRVSLKDLPVEVVTRDGLDRAYANRSFLSVDGHARYRYVVEHHRVRDFFHGQRFLGRRLPLFGNTQYVLIRSSIIDMLAGLHIAVRAEGLDESAITVVSGFRPPRYNKSVGGKSRSRHLHGDAVDIKVGDVNRDGRINQKDRQAIYRILDKKIVRSKGGLGTYKNSPHIIHFDARGKRARWRY